MGRKMADAILVFAFGAFDDKEVLTPNQLLAVEAAIVAERLGIKNVVIQKDIPAKAFFLTVHCVEDLPRPSFGYLSTLGVVKGFQVLAKQKGWKSVLVVAAPPHIWRCIRDLKKMEFMAYEDPKLEGIDWFDKRSKQLWTRYKLLYWSREILLRLLPWKIYEKLAG